MTEPTYGDYIAYNNGFIISVAIALRAAGVDDETSPLWTPEVIPGDKGGDDTGG